MRIFDSDGNDFLDFKEFLMAIDIATCQTEESKLKWAFKLFDVDNNGSLEVGEMISVMETLESIDGETPNSVPTDIFSIQNLISFFNEPDGFFRKIFILIF